MRFLSKRGRIRAVAYTAFAFVILAGYCISIYQSSLNYQRTIANSYRRAFSQVVSSVERIDNAMQKEIYVVTPAMVSVLSAEIQTEASVAQQALSELPYANVELEQTAAFLSKVGDYASALARSATDGLTEEESAYLETLSMAASQLRERLEALEIELNEGTTSLATAAEIEQRLSELTEDDSVLAGSTFENVETDFPELPTMTYDGPFSDHLASSDSKYLRGLSEVTADEAIAAAANLTGLRESVFTLTGEVNGEIPCYTLEAAVDGGTLTVEVTKVGGIVLELTNSRSVGDRALSADDCADRAEDFLERCGFEDMEETYRYNNEGRLTVNFAYEDEDILCYPDLCSVTVAMDTGSVVSFECTSYVSNHTRRGFEPPVVTVEQARETISPKLQILKERLAVIPTEGEFEVLCWEFICQAENGQHYIVCINANTGAEQKILILLEDENGTLTV